jgi:hypothetical protein
MAVVENDKHLHVKMRIQVSEIETGKFIDSDDVDLTLPSHEILEWFANYGRAVSSVFCAKQNIGIRITGPVGAKIAQIKGLRAIGIECAGTGYIGLKEAKDAIELVSSGPHLIIKGLSITSISQIELIAQINGISIEVTPTSLASHTGISKYVIVVQAKCE